MSRSLFKGPYIKNITKKKKKILQNKNATILPSYINKTFLIHTGVILIPVHVKEEMIGHKFGIFVRSRSIFKFKKKNK